MDARKPRWTTASFLLYAGGLTVLGAAIGALGYLSGQYGSGAFAGWALLVLVVLYGIATEFRRRDRWLVAGVFAFTAVIAWAAFVGALWSWFGWISGSVSFSSFSLSRLALELLVLVAAIGDMRLFRFPWIASIAVFVGWFFVIDLLSAGGNWTAVLTLLVGIVYLLAGAASDSPAGFWLHFAAGLLIGGSFLYWLHSSDFDWALISVAALAYVAISYASKRSSWAVFGTIGLLAAGTHFSAAWGHKTVVSYGGFSVSSSFQGWVPALVFAFVGFLLVVLGLASRSDAET
ncbi:MAG TPA: hypothetical protein VMT74_03325 [Gaiellaceae bacterium]|nr:hypothetical protein [Gaiellaceae bacterium]